VTGRACCAGGLGPSIGVAVAELITAADLAVLLAGTVCRAWRGRPAG
jgi:hypothetical protein